MEHDTAWTCRQNLEYGFRIDNIACKAMFPELFCLEGEFYPSRYGLPIAVARRVIQTQQPDWNTLWSLAQYKTSDTNRVQERKSYYILELLTTLNNKWIIISVAVIVTTDGYRQCCSSVCHNWNCASNSFFIASRLFISHSGSSSWRSSRKYWLAGIRPA